MAGMLVADGAFGLIGWDTKTEKSPILNHYSSWLFIANSEVSIMHAVG